MLARPTLCGGSGGAVPGFRGDFSTSCPLPGGSGFSVRPVALPLSFSDKDGAPRKGTVSEVDGGGRGEQKAGFKGMAEGTYLLWIRAWRRGVADMESRVVATLHFV